MNIYNERIFKLRALMKQNQIDAYLIVTDDFHASEYVCDFFKCREFISGFTGSAGTIIVTADEARLWTDGRYFLQAAEQLKESEIILMKSGMEGVLTIEEYLAEKLSDGECLGYDGRTIRVKYAQSIKEALAKKKLRYIENVDLVGEIWENRPAFPKEPVWILSEKYAGKSRSKKIKNLRETIQKDGADAILITSLDDIAWLYNLRGNDIAYNPVTLAYTMVYKEGAVLYMNPEAVSGDILKELKKDGIEVAPYFQIYEDIRQLKNLNLWIDEKTMNVALRNAIPKEIAVIDKTNPTTLAKAIKNETERENEKFAHVLDGVAVTKLIYWLKQLEKSGEIVKLTEMDVCSKLEEFREKKEGYLQQSFSPIVATGKHGAIVHYEPALESNTPLENNTFVLMDTGAQYLYGTTDITRTVAIGELTQEQKIHYTAVLKGHLNLSNAKFKYGCSGVHLDYLARSPIWDIGMDFQHGTGHGVGYLLNVHEGPNGIRMKETDGSIGAVLEEGMITSNEPGIYLEGKYGIRIENLMLCLKDKKTAFGQFMKFETLTMVPYERSAILPEMLTKEETVLLNQYHAMVYEKISSYLTESERAWLKEQTRPF